MQKQPIHQNVRQIISEMVVDEGRMTELLDTKDPTPAPVHDAKDDHHAASILSKHHGDMIHFDKAKGFYRKGARGQPLHLGRTAKEADLAMRRSVTGKDLKESSEG